jgi:hypothetical protein
MRLQHSPARNYGRGTSHCNSILCVVNGFLRTRAFGAVRNLLCRTQWTDSMAEAQRERSKCEV